MARGIDDWFLDREWAGDRDPTYDPFNDDAPDPFVFGEAPPREFAVPASSGGRKRRAKVRQPKSAQPQVGSGRSTSKGTVGPTERSAGQVGLSRSPSSTPNSRSDPPRCHPSPRPFSRSDAVLIGAVRRWHGANLGGSAGDCQRDLKRLGWAPVPTQWLSQQLDRLEMQRVADAARKQKQRKPARPTRTAPTVTRRPDPAVAAIRTWFAANPGRSIRDCRDALKGQGHPQVTRAQVAAVHRTMRRKPGPAVTSPSTPSVRVAPVCPACGIVPDRYGGCRCS